jgi:hypothetical protein
MPQTLFERMELKFVVSRAQREALTDEIARHLAPDPFGDANGAYPTVDLYYDSPDHELYWQRWRDWTSRRKLRLRVYGGGATAAAPSAFLEIKHSLDGRICKRRVALEAGEALAVAAGAPPPAGLPRGGQRLVEEIQTFVRSYALTPMAVVRCERQAFVGRDEEADLRVTFDQNVGWRRRDLVPRPDDRDMDGTVLGDDPCVLEVKVDLTTPRWLVELITREGCVMSSHSKYGAAIAASLGAPSAAPRRAASRRERRKRPASLEAAWTR